MYKTPGGTPAGKMFSKPVIKSIEEMESITSRDNVFDESMAYDKEEDEPVDVGKIINALETYATVLSFTD